MALVYETALGRTTSSERRYHYDRLFKLLYDVTTSSANNGRIGASFDAIYLGMGDLNERETRNLLKAFEAKGFARKTARGGYRLTDGGKLWVERNARPGVLRRS